MQLLKDLIYGILSVQEKILKNRLSRTLGVKSHSKKRRHFAQGCIIDLSMLAEIEKENLEAEITNILKANDYEPIKLLNYIQTQGTNVVYSAEAKKILNPIGENEGFIYPARGFKALYLSFALFRKLSLKTDEMFVMSRGEINKYYFIYQFYNWCAFKKGIDGMDSDSQELLKKYLFAPDDTKELQLADIFKLKDAIRQDKASIEFVIKLCKNYDGAKNALEKLKDGGANL